MSEEKIKCDGCSHRTWSINLYEGLCHDCWREANPDKSCVGCIHATFYVNCECESCIDCAKDVKVPLDCYSRDRVPHCEHNEKGKKK